MAQALETLLFLGILRRLTLPTRPLSLTVVSLGQTVAAFGKASVSVTTTSFELGISTTYP